MNVIDIYLSVIQNDIQTISHMSQLEMEPTQTNRQVTTLSLLNRIPPMNVAGQSSATTFRPLTVFMDLPPELRIPIYEAVLHRPERLWLKTSAKSWSRDRFTLIHAFEPPIARTNRTIHRECCNIQPFIISKLDLDERLDLLEWLTLLSKTVRTMKGDVVLYGNPSYLVTRAEVKSKMSEAGFVVRTGFAVYGPGSYDRMIEVDCSKRRRVETGMSGSLQSM